LNEFRKKFSFPRYAVRAWRNSDLRGGSVAGASTKASVEADLTAQFPVKSENFGSDRCQVIAGESLLLVEAMKMEFAIKAPTSGKVLKLLVIEGQQLSPGDRFLDFEILENPKALEDPKK